MRVEDALTQILVDQLRNGGIKKLTRAQKAFEYLRELGDNSFRADIFITLEKNESTVSRSSMKFIAIEVKVKDWKQGLYQAWRYNAFAEKSYLALYKKHASNVDLALFQQYNVGLIVFDESSIEVLNAPKNNRFSERTYSGELRTMLRSKVALMKGA
jgi:hypothetical protein